MKSKLIEVLNKVGKSTELCTCPDGTSVLLMPYGGRVLGLFSPKSDENFYWTNEALKSAESAKEFYKSEQWHNSGGDRTWLAPEVDVFFPDFPKLDKYFQPRQLDPGSYEVIKSEAAVELVNRLKITLSRCKQEVELEIKKRVGPAANPFRYEKGLSSDFLSNLEYAGYTQYTSLKLLGKDSINKGPVGLWNLVQMPHGGEMIIPTYTETEPRTVMGKIPEGDLIVSDNLIRYKMAAKGEYKISIRALGTTGRIGYLYKADDKWSLIIRNFSVNPSGEYIDVPWDEADYKGFSTQACCVDAWYGSFSELEYHIPAIGSGTGRTYCCDEAQVWAFRGSYDSIKKAARILLTSAL